MEGAGLGTPEGTSCLIPPLGHSVCEGEGRELHSTWTGIALETAC